MKMKMRAVFAAAMAVAVLFLSNRVPAHASSGQGIIRVLLTKLQLTDQLQISLDGSYTLGNNMAFQRGSSLIISCATGTLLVYYEGMVLDAGSELILTRHAISTNDENGLRMNGKYGLYAGDLHLNILEGRIQAVLYIPVEEYLLGVIPYEMNDEFPLEALKAQAVAARTYALGKMGTSRDYDVTDNTNDQVYAGYNGGNTRSMQAVAETAGVCGYVNGAFARCYYTASNGGQIESVENVWGRDGTDYSYIASYQDPYDLENPESIAEKYTVEKNQADGVCCTQEMNTLLLLALSGQLGDMGYDRNPEYIRIIGVTGISLHTPKYGSSSLVMTRIRFDLHVEARMPLAQEDTEIFFFSSAAPAASPTPDSTVWGGMKEVDGVLSVDIHVFPDAEDALALSVNEDDNEIWSVKETEDSFVIEARRYGHGVGMSQRGAQQMAGVYGWTYEQILRFYYPGMTLKASDTAVTPAPEISSGFLATPGPAATPTPRPTLMPATDALSDGQWRVSVTLIGENSTLNLRDAPSLTGSILRQLFYGQELIVIEQTNEDWLHVKTDDMEGYIMAQYVEIMD